MPPVQPLPAGPLAPLMIDELRHPLVRDLVSVLEMPGMLAAEPARKSGIDLISDDECARWVQEHRERLAELDRDPGPLREWLERAPGSPLLGRYFESLVAFWIRELLGARRLEASVKVLRAKQVVGELDFVFEGSRGALEHWEVAVKFYLSTARTPEEARRAEAFLGTMTRDRLDKKIARLRDHQLKSPASAEGREALHAAGFVGEPRTRLLMKGALFYRWGPEWREEALHAYPREASSRHQRGWWSPSLPPGGVSGPGPEAWVVLDRRRWLSPFFAERDYEPLTRAGLEAVLAGHFREHRTAFMVAAVSRGGDGAWRESHRGLVVHPGWPWRVIE